MATVKPDPSNGAPSAPRAAHQQRSLYPHHVIVAVQAAVMAKGEA
jgi:hypothetical protein